MPANRYAIIGYPLGHTMSPFIHSRLFEMSGIKGEYDKLQIAPEELESRFDELRAFDGFNITIPHKQSIIKMCDRIEGAAARYSSVNTVKCSGDEIVGYNTDAAGFLKTFGHCGAYLRGSVLLLGAGGAARTAAYESVRAGCTLSIAVRPSGLFRAEALLRDIMQEYPSAAVNIRTLSDIYGAYDIIINATPVGMYPKTDACPVAEKLIDGCGAVFDLIYNPAETRLLRYARQKGKRVLPGMPMLVWQAAAAHEIWYGASFDKSDIDSLIDDAQRHMEQNFR